MSSVRNYIAAMAVVVAWLAMGRDAGLVRAILAGVEDGAAGRPV